MKAEVKAEVKTEVHDESRSETSDASQERHPAMISPPKQAIQQLVHTLHDVAHDWDEKTYTESQFLQFYGYREGGRKWTIAKWATDEAAWALNRLQYDEESNTTFFALRSLLHAWMPENVSGSASNAQAVNVIFRALYAPLRFRAEYLELHNTCRTEWATTDLNRDMRHIMNHTIWFTKFTKSVPLIKSILRTGVERSEWMNNVQTIAREKRRNDDELSE